jgi:DNA polymerase III sliding clamp (beta) subunit (PCNA family)
LESIRDPPDIPDNTINQALTLPGGELNTVFERVHEFADNVVIRSDGERNAVTFEADSDECEVVKQYSDARDLVTGSGTAVFDMDVSASVNSMFNCGYLHNLLNGVKQARLPETCTVRFGDEYPLNIRCEFGSCSDTHIMFMLAPRIQPR